jgi:hypothetical protein
MSELAAKLQNVRLWHALAVQAVSAVALFTGHMDGGTFVAASTITLGIHVTSEYAIKKAQ